MITPYTPASSLRSTARIAPRAWVDALARHIDPLQAAVIVADYRDAAGPLGLNVDLALAQAVVESAWFTSSLWRERHNPCGLGITGPGEVGKDYGTPANGITAHLHHLCCYAYTLAECPVQHVGSPDPRHLFHDGNPALSHLQDATRQWATGPNYVAKILAVANALLAKEIAPMPATKPPLNLSHPSPNRNGYSGTRRPDAIIWHVTAGGEAGSLSWLTNPDSLASANYVIGLDGTIYELVPPTEDAWANGAVNEPDTTNPLIPKWQAEGVDFNQRTVSIETVRVTSANEQPGGFTPAQYQSLVALTAWLCQEFRLTPDRTHIFGHRTIDSVNRPHCPGLAESEWYALVTAVAALVNGATPPPPTVPTVPTPRPVGWLTSFDADVFKWSGEGIITYRKVRYYNAVEHQSYEREWSAAGGYTAWVKLA